MSYNDGWEDINDGWEPISPFKTPKLREQIDYAGKQRAFINAEADNPNDFNAPIGGWNNTKAALQGGAALLSRFAAAPISGLAGIGEYIKSGGDINKAADMVKLAQDTITYTPSNPQAERAGRILGAPLEVPLELWSKLNPYLKPSSPYRPPLLQTLNDIGYEAAPLAIAQKNFLDYGKAEPQMPKVVADARFVDDLKTRAAQEATASQPQLFDTPENLPPSERQLQSEQTFREDNENLANQMADGRTRQFDIVKDNPIEFPKDGWEDIPPTEQKLLPAPERIVDRQAALDEAFSKGDTYDTELGKLMGAERERRAQMQQDAQIPAPEILKQNQTGVLDIQPTTDELARLKAESTNNKVADSLSSDGIGQMYSGLPIEDLKKFIGAINHRSLITDTSKLTDKFSRTSAFNNKPVNSIRLSLGELIKHDEFFNKYPDARNVEVVIKKGVSREGHTGLSIPSENRIVLYDFDNLVKKKSFNRTLVHELEHLLGATEDQAYQADFYYAKGKPEQLYSGLPVEGVKDWVKKLRMELNPGGISRDSRLTAGTFSEGLARNARDLINKEREWKDAIREIDRLPPEDQLNLFRSNKNRTGNPVIDKALDTYKSAMQSWVDKVHTVNPKVLQNLMEDYVGRVVKKLDVPAEQVVNQAFSHKNAEGTKGYAKRRTFDTLDELLASGTHELADTNALRVGLTKMQDMANYFATHKSIQADVAAGRGGWYYQGKEPKGWVHPEGSAFQKYIPVDETTYVYSKEPGIEGTNTFKVTKEGTEAVRKGVVQGKRFYAKPEVAAVYTNFQSKGISQLPVIGDAYRKGMKVAGTANESQLGWGSMFHAGFTTQESLASNASIVSKQLYRLATLQDKSPVPLVKSIGNLAVNLATASGKGIYEGHKLLKEYLNPGTTTPEKAAVLEDYLVGGGKPILDKLLHSNAIESFQKSLDKREFGKVALKSPFALMRASVIPTMDFIVPRQKLAVFEELRNEWRRITPDATPDEVQVAMREIVNRVDARLGQVNYDRLFMNNAVKQAFQLLYRAPGWKGGTTLEVIAGAPKDTIKFISDWAKSGKAPKELPDRTAYVLGLTAVHMVMMGTITKLATGDDFSQMKPMDFIAARTNQYGPDGKPLRIISPSYVKDILHFVKNPKEYGMTGLNPILVAGSQLYNNKNYKGIEIHDINAPTTVDIVSDPTNTKLLNHWVDARLQDTKFLASQLTPFWVSNIMRGHEQSGELDAKEVIPPFFGFNKAPSYLTDTAAESEAKSFQKGPQERPLKEEGGVRRQAIQTLSGRFVEAKSSGKDIEPIVQDIQTALKEGKITAEDITTILKKTEEPSINKLTDKLELEEWLRVLAKASPQEKQLMIPKLEQKLKTLEKMNPQQKERVLRTVDELFRR